MIRDWIDEQQAEEGYGKMEEDIVGDLGI